MEKADHLSVLTLSAKSDRALNSLANAYQEHLQANPGINASDLCHTANACRSHFSHRLALVGRDTTQISDLLNAYAAGQKNGDGVANPVSQHLFKGETEDGTRPKIAFLFLCNADIPCLTRELYDTLPGFREKIELCASLFEPYVKSSILEWLCPETPDKPSPCPDGVKEGVSHLLHIFNQDVFSLIFCSVPEFMKSATSADKYFIA